MNQRLCDIRFCKKEAKPYDLEYLRIEVVPTGNSDYSSTEEQEVRNDEFDLCPEHAEKYDKRIGKVIVKDESGLYFP